VYRLIIISYYILAGERGQRAGLKYVWAKGVRAKNYGVQ
jgi:hypothetical protein